MPATSREIAPPWLCISFCFSLTSDMALRKDMLWKSKAATPMIACHKPSQLKTKLQTSSCLNPSRKMEHRPSSASLPLSPMTSWSYRSSSLETFAFSLKFLWSGVVRSGRKHGPGRICERNTDTIWHSDKLMDIEMLPFKVVVDCRC